MHSQCIRRSALSHESGFNVQAEKSEFPRMQWRKGIAVTQFCGSQQGFFVDPKQREQPAPEGSSTVYAGVQKTSSYRISHLTLSPEKHWRGCTLGKPLSLPRTTFLHDIDIKLATNSHTEQKHTTHLPNRGCSQKTIKFPR
jgi:hypothetical protein